MTHKPPALLQARVGRLDADGTARVEVDGRVYAVDRAIPGEVIEFDARKKRRGKYRGVLTQVIEASASRVAPRCSYFGVCGGCTQQHIDADAQVVFKEAELFRQLAAAGVDVGDGDGAGDGDGGDGGGDGDGGGGDGDGAGAGAGDGAGGKTVRLPPLHGTRWKYRRKARLGLRYVPKKGGLLVGFRERGGGFITSLRACPVLDARLSKLLPALHETLGQLDAREQIPQLEVAAADNAVALVLRHLQALSAADAAALKRFARENEVRFFLQPGGLDSVTVLWPEPGGGDDSAAAEPLFYRLKNYELTLRFEPTDFIQINAHANDLMLESALELLRPAAGDSILDLFCGIGNFTLALARSGARVLGVEGDPGLLRRAAQNAKLNRLDNAEFARLDLESMDGATQTPSLLPPPPPLAGRQFDKILLDPPRSGAAAVVRHLIPAIGPRVIVYVSCNPVTLARDAAALVSGRDYALTHAGVIDMFPHTARVESIARFARRA